jgi:hypothetical protein
MLLRSEAGWQTRRVGLDPAAGRSLHQSWSDWRTLVDESWRDIDDDPKQRPWYRGAMALTRATSTHWTEPYTFFTTREPGVTASMRWSAGDGGGIVAFDILLSDITAFTSRLVVSRRGRALVLTRAGEVVGPPPGATTAAALTPLADLGSPALENAYAAWEEASARGAGAAAQGATFTVEASLDVDLTGRKTPPRAF